jgi:hypothetical protein
MRSASELVTTQLRNQINRFLFARQVACNLAHHTVDRFWFTCYSTSKYRSLSHTGPFQYYKARCCSRISNAHRKTGISFRARAPDCCSRCVARTGSDVQFYCFLQFNVSRTVNIYQALTVVKSHCAIKRGQSRCWKRRWKRRWKQSGWKTVLSAH